MEIDELFRTAAKLTTLLALVFVLGLATGCESDEPAGLSPVCIEFVSDLEPVSGEVVAVRNEGSVCDTAVVDLIVSGIDDVWSAQFEIVHPDLISQVFVDVADSFLTSDGNTPIVTVQIVEPPPDQTPTTIRIEVGITRTDNGSNIGIDATDPDQNLLARIFFVRSGLAGAGELLFEDANLNQRSSPIPGEPVPVNPPVPFRGGSLVVN